MLNIEQRKRPTKRSPETKSKPPTEAALELINISKWQDILACLERRYVRNEALQMAIELLISVRNARSIAKGKLRGKTLEPVLKDISATINRGSVVGVIDIGGRSRMALLNILANSEAPSRGEVRIFGKMTAFSHLGALLFDQLTCRELLLHGARLMGVPRRDIPKTLEGVSDFSGLGHYLDTPLRRTTRSTLTDLGISLLCCLDYDVLVVNEMAKPTSKVVATNWEKYLASASIRGKTVVMTSRSLRAVVERSTHLLLIRDAELLDYGEANDLKSRHHAFIEEACNAPMVAQATQDDDNEELMDE